MKKAFIILLASLGFVSCVEDEGNYTYTELNQITIEGLEESYNVLDKVDSIKIYPTIKGTLLGDDLSNYEYQWHVHEGVGEHKHTFIGNDKDLEYKVDLGIGTYTLYFTVKDKTTGLEAQASASIKTSTAISKGFMLLGDDMEEGIMGLDMIVMPAGRDTTVAENVYDNSETKFKGADRILYQGARFIVPAKESVWMCTEDGSFRMEHHDGIFEVISEINDYHMIETEFEHKEMRVKDVFPHQYYATYSNNSYNTRGYMTEDMIVIGSVSQAEYYATPCNRTSENAKEMFEFFPFVFYHEAQNNGYTNTFLIYNTTDSCFMKTYWGGVRSTYCLSPNDNATDFFPWNQKGTGRTLVWGGNTLDALGHSLAMMKDEEGRYFLYKFIAGGSYGIFNLSKKGFYEIDLDVAPHFAEATHYMASATGAGGSLLMYTYGSTLYLYNYAYKSCKSFDMGAEITCLEPEYLSKGSRTSFMIATYSDSEKGIVRKYDVGTDPNNLEIVERPGEVWKTRLRVKDIEWKQ